MSAAHPPLGAALPASASFPVAGADAESEIRHESIRTLYAQMRNTSLASVVVSIYMVGASWAFTEHWVVLAWAAVQVMSILAREGLIRAFHKRRPPSGELERWARYYVVHQAAVGLIWGATIFLFAHPDQPVTVALTLCCLYSIGAGAVPAQSYTPASLYAVVGILYTLVAARLASVGSLEFVLLGAATGLFGLTMVGFCRVQARTLSDGFRIRFENRALLAALTARTAEAEEARNKAELASLAKSQFLAAASHDLRQPLYALSLFSASLKELKLDDESRSVVGRIQDSVAVMESLFDGLLDISRLEAGVVEAHIDQVSVDALFDRLSQVFHPIAVDRGLDLRFRSDGEWVRSDATLVEQVLSNLLSNAMRHTHSGGVLVAARKRGGQVRLEIWDTGIGIGEADLQRIFEEFVQVHNPQRDRRKGLGLGLSIARRAAALIGTTIDVRSRPGKGSRFMIAQPACAGIEVLPCVPAEERMSVQGRVLPVMVIEDDEDVRTALADLLTRWGIVFDMFEDGERALASVEGGRRYGLVLADYRLPGRLNGLDLIAAIAGLHATPAPAAVLITGDFDSDLIGRARERGIPLLHKPLQAAVLRQLVGGATEAA
ncbi:MAG TPA: hybrid sensor histidine kinase/response regulator [Allosphingosinicella sp.]|jgi:signal transduction histidine kinase|nr:hybrid sensor histidine kinase/response regulator [Allosphingosinicella sp.]